MLYNTFFYPKKIMFSEKKCVNLKIKMKIFNLKY